MAKKYFLPMILTCFFVICSADGHAVDLGFSAGPLFPYSKFNNVADTGFGIGYHVKMNVYQAFNYGLAINYGSAEGDFGVEYWAVDIYPFIDWIFYRTQHMEFFTRGGIGLFHWESDNIWWLGSEGNGIISSFGVGCKIGRQFELLANINKQYADFDVDFFMVRAGYNFDIGE